MSRRSVRLQSSGYYNPDGSLTVCYKETRVRKWKYRRYDHTARETSLGKNISCSRSSSWNGAIVLYTLKHCFVSVMFLTLFYGFTSVIDPLMREPPVSSPPTINAVSVPGCEDEGRQIQEVKGVLVVLQNKMDYLLPSADLLPNFALKSQGAKVVEWMPLAVHTGQREMVNWFGFVIQRPSVTPNIVIQGRTHLNPGECWAFEGSQGHLAIALSHRVVISHVTLGHLPKMLSLTGDTWSAPKEFSVYGMRESGQEWSPLGTFLYDKDQNPLQTFALPPIWIQLCVCLFPVLLFFGQPRQMAAHPESGSARGFFLFKGRFPLQSSPVLAQDGGSHQITFDGTCSPLENRHLNVVEGFEYPDDPDTLFAMEFHSQSGLQWQNGLRVGVILRAIQNFMNFPQVD